MQYTYNEISATDLIVFDELSACTMYVYLGLFHERFAKPKLHGICMHAWVILYSLYNLYLVTKLMTL